MRDKLKKLKLAKIQEQEDKYNQMIKEKRHFEELLERYSKYKTKDVNKTLLYNRNGRHSVQCASQPILEPLNMHKMNSEDRPREKEVRLQFASNPESPESMSRNDNKMLNKLDKLTKSQSMINLKQPENLQAESLNNSFKIHTIDEFDELTIEEQMSTLPHWKYKASFYNYVRGINTVSKDVIDDFMVLYKNKDYVKIFEFLQKNKPLK